MSAGMSWWRRKHRLITRFLRSNPAWTAYEVNWAADAELLVLEGKKERARLKLKDGWTHEQVRASLRAQDACETLARGERVKIIDGIRITWSSRP